VKRAGERAGGPQTIARPRLFTKLAGTPRASGIFAARTSPSLRAIWVGWQPPGDYGIICVKSCQDYVWGLIVNRLFYARENKQED